MPVQSTILMKLCPSYFKNPIRATRALRTTALPQPDQPLNAEDAEDAEVRGGFKIWENGQVIYSYA
jgi:hypothetical protein